VNVRGTEVSLHQLERLRIRCWELEVALDWYLQRIHQLEAYVGAVPDDPDARDAAGDAGLAQAPRPRLVASGDDAAERHFARIAQYETELRVADAASSELSRKLQFQATEAADRLTMLEAVARERDVQSAAAEERLAAVKHLAHELEVQSEAARDRLATIERLLTEHAAEARVAAESLRERDATIQMLIRERDLQTEAAGERLAIIEQMIRERD
jgi:hypothetical protein